MHWKNPLIAALLILSASMLFAQELPEDEQDEPVQIRVIPTEGFWPTRIMMERVIDRIVDQMAKHYNFDEEQTRMTREMLKVRYPDYLNSNRAEIQTLLNKYFEALVNDKPPTPEEVAEWAKNAQPMLAGLGEVTHEVMDTMHEYLNDDQIVMLDAELVAFDAGMQMAQNKLSVWADGGFDPDTEWIFSTKNRQSGEEEGMGPEELEDSEEGVADEDARAKSTMPVDEWALYTQRFIERYQLNDEQKQKAHQILRRQQEARDNYLRRKADEMKRVTQMLADAKSEEEQLAALKAYEDLNEPVNQLFKQLKDRLDALPTRAQRNAAPSEELEPPPPTVQPSPTSQETPPQP